MSTVVYKYPLDSDVEVQQVLLPVGARILHVDLQNKQWQLWALVDTESPLENRHFVIVGTGMHMDRELNYKHITTYMTPDHAFVFHVFEVIPMMLPADYDG